MSTSAVWRKAQTESNGTVVDAGWDNKHLAPPGSSRETSDEMLRLCQIVVRILSNEAEQKAGWKFVSTESITGERNWLYTPQTRHRRAECVKVLTAATFPKAFATIKPMLPSSDTNVDVYLPYTEILAWEKQNPTGLSEHDSPAVVPEHSCQAAPGVVAVDARGSMSPRPQICCDHETQPKSGRFAGLRFSGRESISVRVTGNGTNSPDVVVK